MQGSSLSITSSVSHISFLYNISRHSVPNSKHLLQCDRPADDVIAVSDFIKQLLTLKNNVYLSITTLDIKSGIGFLCTQGYFYVIVQLHVPIPW